MSNNCDCCNGFDALTPLSTANRPGLMALRYRVGTHASFLETMLARLSSSEFLALSQLKTRDPHDPAIALLDAWATVADVLTFYQERIANEGYLRTAMERQSVLELTRLVNYQLRPGVASSVYLAFTMEPGFNENAKVPKGTRSQSIPAPGETPQSFETEQDEDARTEWNLLQPRLTRPQFITRPTAANQPQILVAGTGTNLKPNDPLLLVFEDEQDPVLRYVQAAIADSKQNHTQIQLMQPTLESANGSASGNRASLAIAQPSLVSPIFRPLFSTRAGIPEGETPRSAAVELPVALPAVESIRALAKPPSLPPANAEQLKRSKTQAFAPAIDIAPQLLVNLKPALKPSLYQSWGSTQVPTTSVLDAVRSIEKFSVKAAPFGHNAPLEPDYSDGVPVGFSEWELSGQDQLEQPVTLQVELLMEPVTPSGGTVTPRAAETSRPRLNFSLTQGGQTASGSHLLAQGSHHVSLDNAPDQAARVSVFNSQTPWAKFVNHSTEPTGIDIYIRDSAQAAPQPLLFNLLPNQESAYLALSSANVSSGASVMITPAGRSPDDSTATTLISTLQPQLAANHAYSIAISGELTAPSFAVTETDIAALKRLNEQSRAVVRFLQQQREIRIIILGNGDGLLIEIENGDLYTTRLQRGESIDETIAGHRIHITGRQATGNLLLIRDEALSPSFSHVLALDAEYDRIVPQSWVAIARPGQEQPILARVQQVTTVSKAEYGITGRVTQLTLDRPWLFVGDESLGLLRETTVYAQSEPLTLTEEIIDPIANPIGGTQPNADTPFEIELARLYNGLKPGRWLIVSGERIDIPGAVGVRASELVMLAGVRQGVAQVNRVSNVDDTVDVELIDLPGDTPHSFLQLAQPLAYTYKRDTVNIYGNVIKATHGETRREVLGSGDGSKALQQFDLSKPPLTYRSAPTHSGVESTLEVRVNDVQWREVENLTQLGATDRGFITRTDNNDQTTIIFGDGVQGARLPSGAENVKAVYRDGIGTVGNVKAEQIKLLATRPLGVKGVLNPLAATGGADRETLLQAKRNAPLSVMALDRLVSVQDYADFVRTFAGITKADARSLSNGRRELIHVTVATANSGTIDPNSDLYRNLQRALHRYGDPGQPIQIAGRELMLLILSARVRILPEYLWETVSVAIRAALLDQFSGERRELGQDVRLSEVISTIHQVPGVDYVDVDLLDSVSETEAEDPATLTQKLAQLASGAVVDPQADLNSDRPQPRARIPVQLARTAADLSSIQPAQLAILSPDLPETLKLEEIAP